MTDLVSSATSDIDNADAKLVSRATSFVPLIHEYAAKASGTSFPGSNSERINGNSHA